MTDRQVEMRVDELARPQRMVLVRKSRLQAYRPRRLIDLVVDERERAFGELRLVVATEGNHFERPLGHRMRNVRQCILGQAEDERDRLDLREQDETGLIGRVDDVALVDEPYAGAAGDGCGDRGVAELNGGI